MAHASPSPKPVSWRPATRAPGTRSSSYQARLVAATSAPGRQAAGLAERDPREQRRAIASPEPVRPLRIGRAGRFDGGIRVRDGHRGSREAGVLGRDRHPDECPLGPLPDPGRDGDRVAIDRSRLGDRGEEHRDPPLELVQLRGRGHPIEDGDRQAVGEDRPERPVDRLELELSQRIVE